MKREVSPILAIVLILIAIAAVQVFYWRGLVYEAPMPPGKGGGPGGGRGGGAVAEVAMGLPDVSVTTIAGAENAGYRDGAAAQALFDGPVGIAVSGETVYIADSRNNAIRVLRGGQVTTLAGGSKEAGFADGAGSAARFSAPDGVAVGPGGGVLVADTGNHRIRRIAADGAASTVAGAATPRNDLGQEIGGDRDGQALQAQFRYPVGLAADAAGAIYVADAGNHKVRRISPGGEVTTIAVIGKLESPTAVGLDEKGSLWVSDTGGSSLWTGPAAGPLRKWSVSGAATARFRPSGLASVGGAVYVADAGGNRVFRIDGDRLALIAGRGDGQRGWADGGGDEALFSCPGLLASGGGALYLADYGNSRIRRLGVAGTPVEEH